MTTPSPQSQEEERVRDEPPVASTDHAQAVLQKSQALQKSPYHIELAAGKLLSVMTTIDWHYVFSAPHNGGEQNATRIIEAMAWLRRELSLPGSAGLAAPGVSSNLTFEERADLVADLAAIIHRNTLPEGDRRILRKAIGEISIPSPAPPARPATTETEQDFMEKEANVNAGGAAKAATKTNDKTP